MSTTEFIVIRHGETAWNAQSRIQGHLDSPLNEEGLAQALLVGERLGHETFSALYSSDLGRAYRAALEIVAPQDTEPQQQTEGQNDLDEERQQEEWNGHDNRSGRGRPVPPRADA